MSSEHNEYLRQFFKGHHSFHEDSPEKEISHKNFSEKNQGSFPPHETIISNNQVSSASSKNSSYTTQNEINLKKLFKSIENEQKKYQNTLHSEVKKLHTTISEEENHDISLESFVSPKKKNNTTTTFSHKSHPQKNNSSLEKKEKSVHKHILEEKKIPQSVPPVFKVQKKKSNISLISSPLDISSSSYSEKKDVNMQSFVYFCKSFFPQKTKKQKKLTPPSSFRTRFISSVSVVLQKKTSAVFQKTVADQETHNIKTRHNKTYRKDIWEKHPERIPFFDSVPKEPPVHVQSTPPKKTHSVSFKKRSGILFSSLFSKLSQYILHAKNLSTSFFSKLSQYILHAKSLSTSFFSSCIFIAHHLYISISGFISTGIRYFRKTLNIFNIKYRIITARGKEGIQKVFLACRKYSKKVSFPSYTFRVSKKSPRLQNIQKREISEYEQAQYLRKQFTGNQKNKSLFSFFQYGKKILLFPLTPFQKISEVFGRIQNQNLKDLIQVSGIVTGVFAIGFLGLRAPGFMAQHENIWNADLFAENQKSIEHLVSAPKNPFADIQALPVAGGITVQNSIFSEQTFFDITPPDTRIVIPKIAKNIPILQVDSQSRKDADWEKLESDIQDALKDGVVHYPGTALPGDDGNVFVTGHSSYYPWDPGRYKDVFAALHNLEIGDEYFIFHKGKKYKYIIQERKVVPPSDVSVLSQDYEKKESTLMTCTPIGTAKNRLILKAVQVSVE